MDSLKTCKCPGCARRVQQRATNGTAEMRVSSERQHSYAGFCLYMANIAQHAPQDPSDREQVARSSSTNLHPPQGLLLLDTLLQRSCADVVGRHGEIDRNLPNLERTSIDDFFAMQMLLKTKQSS